VRGWVDQAVAAAEGMAVAVAAGVHQMLQVRGQGVREGAGGLLSWGHLTRFYCCRGPRAVWLRSLLPLPEVGVVEGAPTTFGWSLLHWKVQAEEEVAAKTGLVHQLHSSPSSILLGKALYHC